MAQAAADVPRVRNITINDHVTGKLAGEDVAGRVQKITPAGYYVYPTAGGAPVGPMKTVYLAQVEKCKKCTYGEDPYYVEVDGRDYTKCEDCGWLYSPQPKPGKPASYLPPQK